MNSSEKMADPLIEGIMNDEPKPGLVDSVSASVKEYILTPSTDNEELEEKRESLAILVSLGTAKDYLGMQMSLGDVRKLSAKDVDKLYFRYQSVLGKQVSGGLVENMVKLGCRLVSKLISIDDKDDLAEDILNDKLVKRELTTAAGYIVLKGGPFVAFASGLFHVACHIDFTMDEKSLTENPNNNTSEHNAEDS